QTVSSGSAGRWLRQCCVLAFTLCVTGAAMADSYSDIDYAERPTGALKLDIYLPEETENPSLVVWIHGGAWQFSDKSDPLALPIVAQGFALASLDFRQATEAPFPAQLNDINEAIRFLRANADR